LIRHVEDCQVKIEVSSLIERHPDSDVRFLHSKITSFVQSFQYIEAW